jgi:hypothetical protein
MYEPKLNAATPCASCERLRVFSTSNDRTNQSLARDPPVDRCLAPCLARQAKDFDNSERASLSVVHKVVEKLNDNTVCITTYFKIKWRG